MKKVIATGAVAAFCLVLTSFNVSGNYLSLQEALRQRKITLKIIPLGGYSGNCINIQLKNISSSALNLEMPSGTIFIPGNKEEQTLMDTQDEQFALHAGEMKTLKVNAFCTEAHDHSPNVNSTFTMSATKRANLLRLATYINNLKVQDIGLIQQAIWCVSDSESVSGIYSDNEVLAKKLRTYVCSLTGQKDTWFATKTKVTEDVQHNIVRVPQEVKGEITFHSDVPVTIEGYVEDASGKIIERDKDKLSMPGGGTITFSFSMGVEGWPAGKYAAVYTSNGKEIIRKEFSF